MDDPKEYEPPVDRVEDVLDREYGFLCAESFLLGTLRRDPRPQVRIAVEKHLTSYPFKGVHPPWVINM